MPFIDIYKTFQSLAEQHKTYLYPFLRIAPAALAGIAVAQIAAVPLSLCFVLLAISIVAAILSYIYRKTTVYVLASVFMLYFTLSAMALPESKLPVGERISMLLQVESEPVEKGRWLHMNAYAGYYKHEGVPYDKTFSDTIAEHRAKPDSNWKQTSSRIALAVDTCYRGIRSMDQLKVKGWLNPMDKNEGSYGKLMARRGFQGRMYVVAGNLVEGPVAGSSTLVSIAYSMQARASSRFDKLSLRDEVMAVVKAMCIGDKSLITPQLRQSYNRSGTAHLLAVSGLHVGIVFIIINLVLYFIPLVRSGHIIKNVLAIVLIWLYALCTGFSPSVIRAALMFSFVQTTLATANSRNIINVIFASALIMLAVNPNYAFDPSFLLSYCAVLAIVIFFPLVYNMIGCGRKWLDILLSGLAVSFVASVGTAPLVSYFFGNIPLAGVFVNPILIFTAYLIVIIGMVWVIFCPIFMKVVFEWGLEIICGLQNKLAQWTASVPFGSIEYRMPLWGVFMVYGFLIAAAVIWGGQARQKSVTLAP